MKKKYFRPIAEAFRLQQTCCLLETQSNHQGSIWGPDEGDNLDDPAQDYKEGPRL